jgi:signal transduction histidine kinase
MSPQQGWWSRYGDLVVPAILVVGLPLELLHYGPRNTAVAIPLAIAVSLVLLARRSAPLATFATVLVLNCGIEYAAPHYEHNSIFFVAEMVYALYSLGAYLSGRGAWLGVPLVLAAVALGAFSDGDTDPAGLLFFVMFCGLPWAAGVAVRLRVERVTALNEANAALREEARRAVAEERARIARELHDVVSHAIAITVLQARGGRRMVDQDEDAVLRALDAIEQTNTAALTDMRRLLALLRDADPSESGARDEPAPSLERLGHLLQQVRESGLPVELEVRGEVVPLTPGLDLSAYRIVQEALTNVLKHAGPRAHSHVAITYGADELVVEVTNSGQVAPTSGSGGHGLIGIRERATVAGGSVEAGPEAGGYAVRARLPYLTQAVARADTLQAP